MPRKFTYNPDAAKLGAHLFSWIEDMDSSQLLMLYDDVD